MSVVTKEMTIGDVMDAYPETEGVFKAHFGQGCFTCPGARVESIAFGAMMHGLDPEAIVKDLNAVIGAAETAPDKASAS